MRSNDVYGLFCREFLYLNIVFIYIILLPDSVAGQDNHWKMTDSTHNQWVSGLCPGGPTVSYTVFRGFMKKVHKPSFILFILWELSVSLQNVSYIAISYI